MNSNWILSNVFSAPMEDHMAFLIFTCYTNLTSLGQISLGQNVLSFFYIVMYWFAKIKDFEPMFMKNFGLILLMFSSGFRIRIMLRSWWDWGNVLIFRRSCINWHYFFFKYLEQFTSTIWAWSFLYGKIKNYKFHFFNRYKGCSVLLFLPEWALVIFIFQGSCISYELLSLLA